MKNENVYSLIITYVVVLVLDNLITSIVEAKYPIMKNEKNESLYWKILFKLRNILDILLFMFTLYFLFFIKLNKFLFFIFIFILLHSIIKFTIEYRYINYLVKINSNNKVLNFLDLNLSLIFHQILFAISLFTLATIFY